MKNIEEYYFITIETKKCNNGNINEILDYCIKIGLNFSIHGKATKLMNI